MGKIFENISAKYNLNEEQRHLMQVIDESVEAANLANMESMRAATEELKNSFPTEALNALRQEVENLKTNRRDEAKKTLRSTLESRLDDIKKANREKKEIAIEFPNMHRAAVLMTVANTLSSDLKKHYAVDGGWDEIRYPENFIIDIIGGREVAKVPPIYKKKLEQAIEGNATLVAPSGLKPLISTEFDVEYFSKVKYAARFEYEEEILDFDELFNNLLNAFENEVIRAWKNGTFSWLTSVATGYVASGMDNTLIAGTVPMGAVISAAALQIASLDYTPNVAYMNIADFEKAKWAQNASGTFLIPPTDTLGSSLRIYSDNSIPTGKILVGDTSTVGEMHSGLIIRFGGHTSTALFENNQEAAIIEIYSLPYLATRNAGAWIYDDIATIVAAVEL